jgi:bifunctional DNA-binding transcriptional regulator/antitoxin component of YhaV-PrlF toxin-antitoxin module
MSTIKITAKRQATFPAELCREMGVKPGDEIAVEKKVVEGQQVWTLVPKAASFDWFGSLKSYAQGKGHELANIRKSIGRGLAGSRSH